MTNYRHYKKGLTFLFEETLRGYSLHAMRYYPYAVRTGNPADRTVVEVFEITDPAIEQAIHKLELRVGYYYDEVKIRRKSIGIYLFKKAGQEPLVKEGDWVKFFGS
jgi:gamma-glutamylcyclotransferase (GGCT)/AIG2-like uncharacterized protein YtfP